MGKLFDELVNKNVKTEIENYLLDRGFYEDKMNPRFMNGSQYEELKLNKKCLRIDVDLENEYILSIFINNTDIYYEVETSYRSYETSGRYNSEDFKTVEDLSSLLDEILERVS